MLSFAYLKELAEVVKDLSAAGIERALTDTGPWRKLQELQRYWERGTRSTLRDDVMFHLAWKGVAETELAKLAGEGWALPLFEHDPDPTQFHTRFTAGEALVMTASGLTLADFREIVTEAVESYGPLVNAVMRIIDDLLRQCGARMPDFEMHEGSFV
jgi:hypothetical protein